MKRFEGRLLARDRQRSTTTGPARQPGSGATAVTGVDGPATVTARYRRRPGGWLFGAALVVPLLLALLGLYLGGSPRPTSEQATASAGQAASQAPVPAPVGHPIAVSTADGKRTVTATVRDEASKKTLLDGVKAASDGLKVNDDITVDSNADAPPVIGVGTVLAAGRDITDLGLTVDRATLTLTGRAADQASGTAAVFAAGQSYPGVRLLDRLQLPGAQPAASGPMTPECDKLRSDIASQLTSTPIKFRVGGSQVEGSSTAQLTDIGKRLAQCPFAHIEVAGHTDNQGSAAANATVSQRRAEAVRTVLVQAGVSAGTITAKGYGPTKPIADNTTEAGRAANRRVEINAG